MRKRVNSSKAYVEAALQVFEELGVKTLSTKDLIKAVRERGLVGEIKHLNSHLTRQIRASELFDTSQRGRVSLVAASEAIEAEEYVVEAVVPTIDIELESEEEQVGERIKLA